MQSCFYHLFYQHSGLQGPIQPSCGEGRVAPWASCQFTLKQATIVTHIHTYIQYEPGLCTVGGRVPCENPTQCADLTQG